jgi:CubicO group peptidase (beta-lactamase class C family)
LIHRRSFLGAAASVAAAASFPRLANAADLSQIDTLAAATHAEMQSPALVYGALVGGKPVLRKGLGVKRLGSADPATPTTLFHMASATKPFVSTAILQRVEAGKLALSDKLYDRVPEFRLADPRAAEITLEQVLLHISGLPDVDDYGWDKPQTDPDSLRRYLSGFGSASLKFAPGESFAYSNIGYEALARVIEIVDRRPFEDALKASILTPLGMTGSTLEYPRADKTRLAAPHDLDASGALRVAPNFPYNRPHAGSSTLISCVDDMLKWLSANLHDGGGIVSPATARLLQQTQKLTGDAEIPLGLKRSLGWFIYPHAGGDVCVGPGNDHGFVSLSMFSPTGGWGFVAMANRSDGAAELGLVNLGLKIIEQGLLAIGEKG